MATLILESLPEGVYKIRIHESGDFFTLGGLSLMLKSSATALFGFGCQHTVPSSAYQRLRVDELRNAFQSLIAQFMNSSGM